MHRMHLTDRHGSQTHCGPLRSADFWQTDVGGLPQSNLHTAVAQARHGRFQASPTGPWSVSGVSWGVFGVWERVSGVSGQREQPSRPAGGEVPHRDSSCLLLLRCGGHFWLADVCHIAVFKPFFPSLSLSLSFCGLSQSLHPV